MCLECGPCRGWRWKWNWLYPETLTFDDPLAVLLGDVCTDGPASSCLWLMQPMRCVTGGFWGSLFCWSARSAAIWRSGSAAFTTTRTNVTRSRIFHMRESIESHYRNIMHADVTAHLSGNFCTPELTTPSGRHVMVQTAAVADKIPVARDACHRRGCIHDCRIVGRVPAVYMSDVTNNEMIQMKYL